MAKHMVDVLPVCFAQENITVVAAKRVIFSVVHRFKCAKAADFKEGKKKSNDADLTARPVDGFFYGLLLEKSTR